jgi:hypothetical protein
MNTTNKRNTDTTHANLKRMSDADDFALDIVKVLDEFEDAYNVQFTTLGEKVRCLNNLGVTRRNGSKWDTTGIRRVLERIEKLKQKQS